MMTAFSDTPLANKVVADNDYAIGAKGSDDEAMGASDADLMALMQVADRLKIMNDRLDPVCREFTFITQLHQSQNR